MCKFLVALCWWLICAVAAPPSAFAFAPQPKFIIGKNDGIHSSISHPLHSTAATIATDEEQSLQQQQQNKETEISYSSILKAIDNDAYLEATQSCSYLVSESPDAPHTSVGKSAADKATYYSPSTPILSTVAVSSLRNAAQLYFNNQRNNEMNNNENNNGGAALGVERVDLDNLLSSNQVVGDILSELNNVLAQSIYPIIRSGWSAHNALSSTSSTSNDNQQQSEQPEQSPVLTVTSASIFANGGHPSAKPSMTTFERDAGLFVVHIDLGNVENHDDDDDANNEVMGGLFVESLINDNDTNNISTSSSGSLPIVGPLLPGQVIIHESVERTAAISVPSNIHELEEVDSSSSTTLATKFSVDCKSRNEIIKAAENARHYALRLVVTTKHQTNNQEDGEDNNSNNIPKVSSEERSYRLRSYARFQEDRAKYVTLAGLLDPLSYENYLWLGFDHITRMGEIKISTKDDLYQQLSAVNKAVYHLEKAAKLCDTDSRVYFQLASARKAKMECEKQLLGEGNMDMDETLYLTQMANELECSAHLESAAVRAGVNDIQDLAICLNALAETHARMKQFDKTLHVIDRWAECSSIRSRLAIEDRNIPLNNLPSYEYIQTPNEKNVAVRTVGEKPVLSEEDIAMLVGAADKRFAIAAGIQTSRYTMQYEGNSEVHLDDLCAGDPILKTKIDTMLQEKIYPLVRATIAKEADGQKPPLGPLCVYDSILVRYNGEKAKAAGRVGASQPLHQDGGIYSVNIALNAHKDQDENGFAGGGTFFEALTVGEDGEYIQRPNAPGHAIVHKTTQRHAGAPTTSGIRDILVIFLTARKPQDVAHNNAENTWGIESAMRLQSIAKELEREKKIPFLRLASNNDPTNSEILYWLGVHLLQGDSNDPSDTRWEEICQGVESLQHSAVLNPADARVHYHLGQAISTRHKYAMRTRRAHLLPSPKEAADDLIEAMEAAIRLEDKCDKAGCKNEINIAVAYLCLGDFMARLKSYDKAIAYLSQVEDEILRSGDTDKEWAHTLMGEVSSMLYYCNTESAKSKEAEGMLVK